MSEVVLLGMNYSVIPFLFILIPLAVVVIVIVRKFPQLALMDVENLPEVKVGKKKNEVLKRRALARAEKAQQEWRKRWQPILQRLKQMQSKFRGYVTKIERRLIEEQRKHRRAHPRIATTASAKLNARSLVQEADQVRGESDLEEAEKKYLTAVRLDPKNVDAYRGLADVYRQQQQWEQAKETYNFILQLDPGDGETLVKLAEMAEEAGDSETAIEYYQKSVLLDDGYAHRFAKLAELLVKMEKPDTALEAARQAVELEPQNPKYLDMWAEISILSQHKAMAEEAYQRLRMVNPENQKLAVFRERIDGMGE